MSFLSGLMRRVPIRLREPHSDAQRQLIEYQGNVVCFAGRRWGKTDGNVFRLMQGVSMNPGIYWWVGLSWVSASMKRAWRLLKWYTRQVWIKAGQDPKPHIRLADKELHWPGGGEIWLRTAEREDSLIGEGLKGAVLDEFSLMRETVWTEHIQPALLDYGGWVSFSGVPKGNNWAAQLWQKAHQMEGWLAFRRTTYDNPFIDPAKIDEMRATMPERLFRQEILAEVVADAGALFRNVERCAMAVPQDEGQDTVFGVDWGKDVDFTVITVFDKEGRMVAFDRFNKIDYMVQCGRLHALARRYKPQVIVAEQNAMGVPLIEQLKREGLPVYAFNTTLATKALIVEDLELAFETGEIEILDESVLINELHAFEMDRLPSGTVRYRAAQGMHDDCVMSLALAWYGYKRKTMRVRTMPSPYGPIWETEPMTKREAAAQEHADTELHRKYAQKHYCPQCHQEWLESQGLEDERGMPRLW